MDGRALEVLKALALGLELREVDGKWAFVGPYQTPQLSGVAPEVRVGLIKAGLVRNDDDFGRLSNIGEIALNDALDSAIRLRLCAGELKGRPGPFSEK